LHARHAGAHEHAAHVACTLGLLARVRTRHECRMHGWEHHGQPDRGVRMAARVAVPEALVVEVDEEWRLRLRAEEAGQLGLASGSAPGAPAMSVS
jgi:hypothetical protein